jgi:hypothetical protein
MTKRNLFAEIADGFDALAAVRQRLHLPRPVLAS